MESDRNSNQPQRELILFRVAAHEFCVDIQKIREIRGWTPVTPLPHAPPFLRGVINLRGAVLPIISLAERFGIGAGEPNSNNVIIVAQIGSRQVGMVVDAVSDIVTVTDSALQPTPDVASDLVKNFVRGLITVDERLVGFLTLDNILPIAEQEAA